MQPTVPQDNIRNFSIIAHIDHGKSTLADRLLEYSGAVTSRESKDQLLDDMELERERGITIKARSVRIPYQAENGKTYLFNLIDTPGHVDFSYEVSRSLAACDGALLVVDAAQGVEAQTIANAYLAIEAELEIIPIINKIDLPSADVEGVRSQIEEILGLDASQAIAASAKQGIGIKEILEAAVTYVPPPKGALDVPLQALIIDSWFDNYQGAVILVKIENGSVRKGTQIRFMSTEAEHEVLSLGVFTPKAEGVDQLSVGEVGYIVAGVRDVAETKIGDTVTEKSRPASVAIEGYQEVKPMVFCGLYTIDTDRFEDLRDALKKLSLNDSSFQFEPETSLALGFGFRCGFLGLLHMEIIKERLEREYRLSLIGTAPTVIYRITTNKGQVLKIDNPAQLPPVGEIAGFEEPYIKGVIITRGDFLGAILKLCQDRRGRQEDLKYLDADRVIVTYILPLNEVVMDFYDRLKSISKGYASFDYELNGYQEADLVKVDLMLNGEAVDALSFISDRKKSHFRGRQLAEKMKEMIPKQMFEVAIQAAIGAKIIARETVSALKKNVTAKCYGGDITRKKKLWAKQKEGKKRMKSVGRVEIPQEAFLAVLKIQE